MAPTRFVTSASLDFVARRLRFLGFDVVTHPGARLEELYEYAAADGRTVLSTSARHPRRWQAVPLVCVPGADPAAALRAVASAHEPAGPPFSRCPRCNHSLQRRTSFEAVGEVPGRVTRAGGPLTYCPSCGQWFWVGSHVGRLRAWLEAALGRPLAEANPGPGENADSDRRPDANPGAGPRLDASPGSVPGPDPDRGGATR